MWGNCRLFLITRVCVVLTLFCLILNHASDWTAFEEGASVRPLTSVAGGPRSTLLSIRVPMGRQKDSAWISDFAIVLQGLHIFFSFKSLPYGKFSILLWFSGHAVGISWKRPIFIKIFLEENFIWQCRLLKLTTQCWVECCVQPQCVDNQIVKSNFF